MDKITGDIYGDVNELNRCKQKMDGDIVKIGEKTATSENTEERGRWKILTEAYVNTVT